MISFQSGRPPVLAGLALLMMCAGTAAPTLPAPSQMTLVVGRGTVVDVPEGVVRVATSNPESVDAVVASDCEVLFHAKAVGQATLVVWPKTGPRRSYEVTVEANLEPLRQLLHDSFPEEDIDVRASRDSLALIGVAGSQNVADRALALVTPWAKGVVNLIQVPPAGPERQVLLRVRFAELNRSSGTEFAVNLLSTGAGRTPGSTATGQFPSGTTNQLSGTIGASSSGTNTKFTLSDVLNVFAFRPDLNLGVILHDLQTRGVLEILAEPNLVAISGKEASFLAGGEFPIPIVQAGSSAGAITVQFHEFGIRLTFLPQLTSRHTIRMHVKPEVSTIDPANGITVSGFRIPALATRRIETDIDLADGQSFAIAGLLDQRATEDLSRIPGLASIPVLGGLFRSHSLTHAKTELVVVVTPTAAAPGDIATPSLPLPLVIPEEHKKP